MRYDELCRSERRITWRILKWKDKKKKKKKKLNDYSNIKLIDIESDSSEQIFNEQIKKEIKKINFLINK